MAFPSIADLELTDDERDRLDDVLGRERSTQPTPSESARARSVVLSERQLEIVSLMSDGLRDGEIAEQLFISRNTAVTHAKHIFAALGARSRAHAVAIALRAGLIE